MRKFLITLLAFVLIAAVAGRPPPPPVGCQSSAEPGPIAGQGYTLKFFDCFDSLNRSVWDDHVWHAEAPNPAWNGFQEVDQNGILHLRTSRNFSCGSGCNYPVNTITSQTSGGTFRQGYFEARMKWTKGNGTWPAFWLLSYRHATNPSWPSVNPACAQQGEPVAHCYAGELDVFEGQGSEPNVFYGTIHRNSCDCYGVSDSQNSNNRQRTGADLTAGFHTYAMLWTVTSVTWYLDGQLLHRTRVYDSSDQPMFLLFSMGQGGWTRPIDSTTPDVIETKVDWVRVWQR